MTIDAITIFLTLYSPALRLLQSEMLCHPAENCQHSCQEPLRRPAKPLPGDDFIYVYIFYISNQTLIQQKNNATSDPLSLEWVNFWEQPNLCAKETANQPTVNHQTSQMLHVW